MANQSHVYQERIDACVHNYVQTLYTLFFKLQIYRLTMHCIVCYVCYLRKCTDTFRISHCYEWDTHAVNMHRSVLAYIQYCGSLSTQPISNGARKLPIHSEHQRKSVELWGGVTLGQTWETDGRCLSVWPDLTNWNVGSLVVQYAPAWQHLHQLYNTEQKESAWIHAVWDHVV